MSLNIFSLNCRGLHKTLKRKIIFSTCRKYDVSCLQETFITEKKYDTWKKEWHGTFFHFSCSSNSKGQILLINDKLKIDIQPKLLRADERVIASELVIDKNKYCIINVYAPNKSKEKQVFFKDLGNFLNKLNPEYRVFICGDFNTVLNNKLDIISGENHDMRDINYFKTFIDKFDLHDIWRLHNPDVKDFTWSKKQNNLFLARRLDYILCNDFSLSSINSIEHNIICCSDHKAVVVTTQTSNFIRGPGIWHFNNSLLHDQIYTTRINKTIDTYINETVTLNPTMRWELLKAEIKSITVQYCTNKNQSNFLEEKQLLIEINRISKLIIENPKAQKLHEDLSQLKMKLEVFNLNKAKGAQVRSKLKYIEEGEKNTNYFLGLEKCMGAQNTIQELYKNNNVIQDPLKILSEIEMFYSTLYQKDTQIDDSKENIENFIYNISFPKLSDEDKAICDSDMSIEEMGAALLKLNNKSSPGCDGFTTPFYKFFWKKIK